MRRSRGISLASISLASEVQVLVSLGTTTHEGNKSGISLASAVLVSAMTRL